LVSILWSFGVSTDMDVDSYQEHNQIITSAPTLSRT
jgi:hypothetical protein